MKKVSQVGDELLRKSEVCDNVGKRQRSREKKTGTKKIRLALRQVQSETGCTTKVLQTALKILQPFLNIKVSPGCLRRTSQGLFRQSGATVLRLNGCVDCHNYVFLPSDRRQTCPDCGHQRCDARGQPHEVTTHFICTLHTLYFPCTHTQICFYFPIKEQLKALLQLQSYRKLLQYEKHRLSSRELMTDVYDSPRWQQKVGPPGRTLTRVVLHGCVDGVPVYKRKELYSVKLLQSNILNLPPWLRYQARHMIYHMLYPSKYKARESRKYYDFVAKYELQDLFVHGVDGVKIIFYGMTLDTPGRREELHMQAVTAFYPCPHCIHTWQPGLRGQVYGGYRRFLPTGSNWRQRRFVFKGLTYMFRDVETRPPPTLRTDRNVAVMATLGRTSRPFCGHKGRRLLHKWPGVDWLGSLCDPMHDIKCFCVMILKGLVGKGSQGCYKSWNNDQAHRDDCQAYDMFNQFWSDPDSIPPWRLSKDAVKVMDSRVCSIWWPHGVDKLCRDNHSFWTHRCGVDQLVWSTN